MKKVGYFFIFIVFSMLIGCDYSTSVQSARNYAVGQENCSVDSIQSITEISSKSELLIRVDVDKKDESIRTPYNILVVTCNSSEGYLTLLLTRNNIGEIIKIN